MKRHHSPGQKGSVRSTYYLEIVISIRQLEDYRKLRLNRGYHQKDDKALPGMRYTIYETPRLRHVV